MPDLFTVSLDGSPAGDGGLLGTVCDKGARPLPAELREAACGALGACFTLPPAQATDAEAPGAWPTPLAVHLPAGLAWIRRLLAEAARPDFRAVVLLRAATDTAWFARLAAAGLARCYLRGRLRLAGFAGDAPHASLVVYLGPDRARFAAAFAGRGVLEGVLKPETAPADRGGLPLDTPTVSVELVGPGQGGAGGVETPKTAPDRGLDPQNSLRGLTGLLHLILSCVADKAYEWAARLQNRQPA